MSFHQCSSKFNWLSIINHDQRIITTLNSINTHLSRCITTLVKHRQTSVTMAKITLRLVFFVGAAYCIKCSYGGGGGGGGGGGRFKSGGGGGGLTLLLGGGWGGLGGGRGDGGKAGQLVSKLFCFSDCQDLIVISTSSLICNQ